MATDGPTPPQCDPEIFQQGKGVCVASGSSNAVERWVKAVAAKANARVDWHYSGGLANILHLGDDASRQRVLVAIEELKDELDGTVLRVGGPSLYREGVKADDVNADGAFVREVGGTLVMEDPTAVAVNRVVEKYNCLAILEANRERVGHFRRRMEELGRSPDDVVIVIVNADDPYGSPLAETLMPGEDWQAIRDRGEVPFARGLADRKGMQEILDGFDTEAAEMLQGWDGLAVVVVDHGVAEVFPA